MEYLISTIKINNALKIGKYWIVGDCIARNTDGFSLEEGKIFEEHNDTKFGYFNWISYKEKSDELIIKNDKRGQLALYYYYDGNDFIVSNNLWKILSNVGDSKIEFLIDKIKEYICFYRIPDGESTIFKNIKTFKPGVDVIFRNNKLNIKEYWDYKFENRSLELNDAVDELDCAIKNFFSRLSPNKIYGFGNSGGLDSRLIAIYLSEFGYSNIGFIIGSKKPNGFLLSQSHNNAAKLSKLFGFKNYFIEFDYTADWELRNLLDIRNNPIGSSNILKNTYTHPIFREFDSLLVGHPGTAVGAVAPKFENKSPDQIVETLFFFYSKRRSNINNTSFDYLTRIKKFLRMDKGDHYVKMSTQEKLIDNNVLTRLVGIEDLKSKNDFKDFYLKNNDKSLLNIWSRHINNIMAQFTYNGAFESMNRTVDAYYLYYPYAFEKIISWPPEFLYDRKALKRLIIKKSKHAAKINDQSGESVREDNISRYEHPMDYFLGKLESRMRGSGLEFNRWIKNSDLVAYFDKTFSVKNPVFDDIFKSKLIYQVYSYPIIIELLKLKRIMDIVYYKQYNILERKDWIIK